MRPVLTIRAAAFQTMLHHAEREQPREAVGLLAAPPEAAASVVLPLPNLAGPAAFLADPYAQYLAEKRIAGEGLRLVAIYHSHPGGGASLSATDRDFARLRDVSHVVIAPAHDDCPLDVRAYRMRDDDVIAVDLRITPQ